MGQETILSLFFVGGTRLDGECGEICIFAQSFFWGAGFERFFFYQGFVSLLELITKVDYHYLESDV